MLRVLEEALKLMRERIAFAVCTVIEKKGSGPANPGDKMIVTHEGGRIGTLGGWSFEKLFIEEVLESIRNGNPRIVEVDITGRDGGGLECGGKVKIFVDVWNPDPQLVVFGAGHIGRVLAKIAEIVGYRVTVVETEKQAVTEEMENLVLVEDYASYARTVRPDSKTYIVITVGEVDPCAKILRELLPKGFPYIGLLGSRRKIQRVKEELRKSGLEAEMIDKVRAPVGINIGARNPGEIAISIIAEIIKISRERPTRKVHQPKLSPHRI